MINLIDKVVITAGRGWVFLLAKILTKTLSLRSPKVGHLFLRHITPLTWIAQSIYLAGINVEFCMLKV